MEIQIVSGTMYASEPSFIVNVGIFIAGSISHLGSTEDCWKCNYPWVVLVMINNM